MPQGLNMQKVADLAGVSKSSVSLALRDDPRLALATRRRIQEVAERLGYRKNPIVASLMAQLRVSQTPKFQANLGLINCSDRRSLFEESTFSEYRDGIRERAERGGYGLEEFWVGEPGVKSARLMQILQARSIRGLLVALGAESKTLFVDQPEFFREFCVVVVGVDRTDPPLPRAASNLFRTVRDAIEMAFRLGYKRPGLVVADRVDKLHDRRFSAGFASAVADLMERNVDPVPPLMRDGLGRADLAKWIKNCRPDAIITEQTEVRDWLDRDKFSIPDKMGLIHLDWTEALDGWAGMRRNARLVGEAAADLVISQITNNEFGPPSHPRLVLIESDFVHGASVRGTGADRNGGKPAAVKV